MKGAVRKLEIVVLGALVFGVAGYLSSPGRGTPEEHSVAHEVVPTGRIDSLEQVRRASKGSAAVIRPVVAPPPLRTRLAVGEGVVDIADRESRDEVWASQVEAMFLPEYERFMKVLMPYAEHLSLTCKHQTCEMTIDVPKAKYPEAFDLAQGFAFGDSFQPRLSEREDGRMDISVTAFFPPEARDPQVIMARFRDLMVKRFTSNYQTVRDYLDSHAAYPEGT